MNIPPQFAAFMGSQSPPSMVMRWDDESLAALKALTEELKEFNAWRRSHILIREEREALEDKVARDG